MKEPEKCKCKCPVERLINLLFLGYVDREKKKPLVFHFPWKGCSQGFGEPSFRLRVPTWHNDASNA